MILVGNYLQPKSDLFKHGLSCPGAAAVMLSEGGRCYQWLIAGPGSRRGNKAT